MTHGLEALGRAVRTRRTQLGLTQEEVNAHGGPSDTTLTKIENGEGANPAASTLRKLDTALRWRPGSAQRVLEGEGDAEPLKTPPDTRPAARRDRVVAKADPIDAHLNKLARVVCDRVGATLPEGFIPVPLSALIELSIRSLDAETMTGVSAWVAFDELDEGMYDQIVSEIEDLEREVESLTEFSEELVRTFAFEGDQNALRRLRRQVIVANNERRRTKRPVWKYSYENYDQPTLFDAAESS